MKLLLIFPPDLSALSHGSLEQFREVDVGCYPPLGLMYIAAYLKKYSKHDVEILDAGVEKLGYEGIKKAVKERDPDVVGIYASCFTIYDSYQAVKASKEAKDNVRIVLGGPHVDIYPIESLALSEVDFIVMGEGEATLAELLNYLENKGTQLSEIEGIGYKKNGQSFIATRRPYHPSLDALPFPARHLTPFKKYYSLIGKNEISTTIMASRGCPSNCNFCHIPYGRSIRMRSPSNVCDELEECVAMGIKEFFFFDENFTINRKRTIALCEEIVKRGINIYFDVRSRVNTVDEEVCLNLKKAGCERIQFGVESGSPRILEAMNKRISLELVEKTFKIAKRAGLTTYADFMIGYPGETKEDIEMTMELAERLEVGFVQYGITMLFPQTKIYNDALQKGSLKEDFWRNVAKDPTAEVSAPLASESFNKEELEEMLRTAYSRFYFRPRYIFRRLLSVNSLLEFKRQAGAGLHVMRKTLRLH